MDCHYQQAVEGRQVSQVRVGDGLSQRASAPGFLSGCSGGKSAKPIIRPSLTVHVPEPESGWLVGQSYLINNFGRKPRLVQLHICAEDLSMVHLPIWATAYKNQRVNPH